jgi:drug/metabolite transporter, DME family
VLAFLGGVSLSFGGVMFRLVEDADHLQVLLYRSAGFAIGALIFVLIKRRGQMISAFRGIGRAGLVASVILGLAIPFYTLAIQKIPVANALFVVSTSPLFAAIVGLIVLREKVKAITWIAAGVALIGVGVMLYGAFSKEVEAGLNNDLLTGNVMALVAALGLGSYAVALRFRTGADMSPALILAGVISASIALAPIYGDIAVNRFDLILCLAMGLQAMLGFALLTFGARYIPAAEVALLSLMEVMLGPIWVELFIGEAVDKYTLFGGPIVLAAVLAFSIIGVRDARRRRSERRAAGLPAGRRAALPEPPLPSEVKANSPARADMTGALAFALRRAERTEDEATAAGRVPQASESGEVGDEAPHPSARPRPAPPADPFAEAARYLTVEYRLRERLAPVLREWVEANLPRIAESMVRGEVRRLIDRVEDAREDAL